MNNYWMNVSVSAVKRGRIFFSLLLNKVALKKKQISLHDKNIQTLNTRKATCLKFNADALSDTDRIEIGVKKSNLNRINSTIEITIYYLTIINLCLRFIPLEMLPEVFYYLS